MALTSKTKKMLGLASVAALAFLFTNSPTTHFSNKSIVRGFRNNNPFNLRKSAVTWLGKISNPYEASFETFDSLGNGLRAGIKNAYTHWNRGKTTISTLVTIWAPPTENNTSAYISQVAKAAGISPTARFEWSNKPVVAKILYQMLCIENGAAEVKKRLTVENVHGYLTELWP